MNNSRRSEAHFFRFLFKTGFGGKLLQHGRLLNLQSIKRRFYLFHSIPHVCKQVGKLLLLFSSPSLLFFFLTPAVLITRRRNAKRLRCGKKGL